MSQFNDSIRIKNLMESVQQSGLDAFIVTGQDSIYYLTGASYKPMERPFFIIVWGSGESPALLVPQLEKEHMRKAKNFDDVASYWDYPSKAGEGWSDQLRSLLKGKKIIGIEPSTKVEIAEELKGFDLKVLPLVENLRLIKSDAEIAAIRAAALFADYGMKLMCSNLYYGVTPLEMFSLSKKIQTKMIMEGEYNPLESETLTACWPAPSSSKPHSIPMLNERVGEGPIQNMSFLRVNGYAAECERTVFIKEPTKEMREIFTHMTEARKIAFNALRPGANCSEVDFFANRYLEDKGYKKYLLHRTGHGIGQSNHEGPYISEGSEDILQTKMVVSIEPGIYIPEIGGFRHSDTVLITDSGYECLTKFPTDLQSLIFTKRNLMKKAKGGIIKRALKL
jgi:Xaa-Pro aminopeptidase